MPTSQTFTLLLKNQRRRDKRYLSLLALGVAVALVFSLSAGDLWLWPNQWFGDAGRLFVWQLRLPRALAVMLVGASLAVAGAVMQALFENPLAEPGLLGVANGAGVALVLTILLSHGLLPVAWMSLSAIIGALAMTLLLLGFARRRRLTNTRLLLVGVALGIVCSAVMTWAVYFSSSLDLRQLMYWMMGGFGGVDWRQKWLIVALLPVVLWLCRQGKALNLMTLGETQARQLGLPLHLWRNLLVLAVGWLVGVSVALAGVIGFVGLVIPHMLRLSGLTDQRYLLPGCALAGAGVLLAADVVARITLLSAELPIGVVTATLGAPLFIWLLTRVKA
ncbi:vitamin B12 ABC transporter permease BtuC [Serratia rhizosphaerae]|uniref:vitamin B12 ABC transporter permease BtuC n=1 Tax=unclassified Serratia (in: enterobacteria) TaxID=2647522 RepID=UPI000CF70FAF|nr:MULTISPECIES: vitamin B12 ABC transporter permease BtuC [unclassified Serratia (in: enterobacteria)]MCA4822156.1 vitamin B12 ABC transporter permease BtuC [Serratia rubidaea]AVJ17419.1 vitamin B12 ABC transporter permease BtuC [Serratia sp. MYb239]QNK30709.1 vitamin B12 ABC transporter permease BtuC [Serratia sp. JUb9]QPT15421.1 vitamin B12 ABC transporter permease BtuC [Serratia rubidaea]CAE1145522.1 vitamin B12 transporter subunit: membrane component of ABC superfamily [Serratia sp. Tan61